MTRLCNKYTFLDEGKIYLYSSFFNSEEDTANIYSQCLKGTVAKQTLRK